MKKVIYLLACVAFLGCYSCSDDDDGLKMQDISVEFAVSDAGMDGTGIDLGIKLSRATKESLDVTVQMISTEVYYSWDYYDSWESHSQTVSFLGVEFPYGKIQMPGSYLYDTIKQSSHVRYLYYVINTEYSGVIYANLKDNTIEDGTPFIQADTIDEAVDYMVSNGTAGLVIFWVVWVILIGAAVFGFCYFDNKWLED